MNKVVIIGNWVKDLELKFTQGGTAVATGTLAVQRSFKKEGQPTADFIPVVIWGKQAETTANYCGAKGNKIAVNGRIQTRSYDAKDGTKRYVTEIIAEGVSFLNSKADGAANVSKPAPSNDGMVEIIDDGDMPF